MAADNFDACLAITLAYEGGFSDLRADPGNWTGGRVGVGHLNGTKYGIAASAHPTLDISALTVAGAGMIYRQDYWHPSSADMQAAGLDLSLFDAAVMSGVGQAKRWLARSIGTAQAPTPIETAIHTFAAARLSFLHALTTWKAFGRGWGARVAGIEAKSLRMALGQSPQASAVILTKAAGAKGKAAAIKTRAKATATGSVAGPAAAHAATGGHHLGLILVMGLIILAGAGILAFAGWRQSQRATALTTESVAPTKPPVKGP